MKGIVLSGGSGSRLYPLTRAVSKQLQHVYDKPLIYYPLSTLIENGVRNICIITTPSERSRFQHLLGDGAAWGLNLEYREQTHPLGIAHALVLAADFIGTDSVALILGDNIFHGVGCQLAFSEFKSGAMIFGYTVIDPSRYGVVELNPQGRPITIEEKPINSRSRLAVPGLYVYDSRAPEIARSLQPSARGELEITDVNRAYLDLGELTVHVLSRGFAWLDAGTIASLHEAASYVQAVERRQGIKIGCPELAAFQRRFISLAQFTALICSMPDCEYRDYLSGVRDDYCRNQDLRGTLNP